MYTVWSIVQATDDILRHIEDWIVNPESAAQAEDKVARFRERNAKSLVDGVAPLHRPIMERGKSGEIVQHVDAGGAIPHSNNHPHNGSVKPAHGQEEDSLKLPAIGDFDYLSYAVERIGLFRDELDQLGIDTSIH